MPWKYSTDDGFVEVIVDHHFGGDILALARVRPVWILDSENNHVLIEEARHEARFIDLFEISRCKIIDPLNNEANFWSILSELDEHYGPYKGIVVHGLSLSDSLTSELEEGGFHIVQAAGDDFVADLDVAVRGRVLGRSYSEGDESWGRA